jgi:hypothetical protein
MQPIISCRLPHTLLKDFLLAVNILHETTYKNCGKTEGFLGREDSYIKKYLI